MNIKTLIQYIAKHLKTNISLYQKDQKLLYSYCPIYDFSDLLICQKSLFNECLNVSSFPKLILIDNQLCYASLPFLENICIIGPLKFFEKINIICQKNDFEIDEKWCNSIFSSNFHTAIEDILLLYNLPRKKSLSSEKLIALNCINITNVNSIEKSVSASVFSRRELNLSHNPYEEEMLELESIETGNIEMLKKCWEEEYSYNYGPLSKDLTRNAKNLCIVVIALASRAAIRGGVRPEISFTLCDTYIQKIEECTIPLNFRSITHQAEIHYAELVAEIRLKHPSIQTSKLTPYIEKSKDYIFTHLHDKIEISDIAAELHLNANYLSSIFRKYEGCTLSQYILNEKIKLAKNMLKYSDYTYSEIATYLGFSSQSHLGSHFKKIVGMTMREYRIQAQI